MPGCWIRSGWWRYFSGSNRSSVFRSTWRSSILISSAPCPAWRASSPPQPRLLLRRPPMNILGISGLDTAESFKREHYPGLDEREYRICQGFDSAAALIVDGELVAAAAEERFCRRKHTGEFPTGAVEYCLREAGLSADELHLVAHGFDYEPYRFAYKA